MKKRKKVCPHCGRKLWLRDFYLLKNGCRSSWCAECQRANKRSWYDSSMSAEERMHTIATLCSANDAAMAKLNKTASMSRHPMSKADRLRVHYLKQSNSCLKQAEFYIIQAMAK